MYVVFSEGLMSNWNDTARHDPSCQWLYATRIDHIASAEVGRIGKPCRARGQNIPRPSS